MLHEVVTRGELSIQIVVLREVVPRGELSIQKMISLILYCCVTRGGRERRIINTNCLVARGGRKRIIITTNDIKMSLSRNIIVSREKKQNQLKVLCVLV